MTENLKPQIHWLDADGRPQQARWRSLAGYAAPKRVEVVDDSLSADEAYRLACEGCGLLWCGDFQNARSLMQALLRRLDSKAERAAPPAAAATASLNEAYVAQRQAQALRTRVLSMLLLPFDADHGVPLRRAPDVRQAGLEGHGKVREHYVASLRELQGLIGAHEWRRNGVPVAGLNGKIHPHYGVFAPVRGEYVELVAQAPLPAGAVGGLSFDIGTGTGVLAAVLARRGVGRVLATDQDPRALACARDNAKRLGVGGKVKLLEADLFPEQHPDLPADPRAALIVCNPPWLPGRVSSPLDHAVYDPDSRMLRGFLSGLAAHLLPGGEGWLILSDLAEHLGLRTREELLGWIGAAGLQVLGRIDAKPQHARAADQSDTLYRARSAELTSLWRLGAV